MKRHQAAKEVKKEIQLLEQYESRNECGFIKRKIIEYRYKRYLEGNPKKKSHTVDIKL